MLKALAAMVALFQVPVHPGLPPIDGETWTVQVARRVPTSFLLTLPDDYATDRKKRWPLLIFLHASGEQGDNLNAVRRHGPPKEIKDGRKFPFIVVCPQCPKEQPMWDPAVLTQLVDMVERRYRVDIEREYVTGISLGGYGTYDLAAANPGRFAAIAPISGGGSWLMTTVISRTPAYIVHGDSDPEVPVDEDRRIAQYLKDEGDDVKYVEVKGGGHEVWSDVYAGTEIYDWLLGHSRRQ